MTDADSTLKIELQRFAYLKTHTLGILSAGELQLASLERPWIRNLRGPGGQPRVSCIPDGAYTLSPWNSEKYPRTFILQNDALGVYRQPGMIPPGQNWGRSAILIHAGNKVQDVIGCIAVGMAHFDNTSVLRSREALNALRQLLGDEQHTITIRPRGTQ